MDPINSSEYIISLDLGGTKLLGILVNRDGEIKARLQSPSPKGNEQVLLALENSIRHLLVTAQKLNIDPTAIAIGAPGFIDTAHGIMVSADNLLVTNLVLAAPLMTQFKIPVVLYHDVRSATLGEAHYGVAQGLKHFALVNIGTGVAVGLYLDGHLYHGANNKSGEIGHLPIAAVGPDRECGDDLRLENLTSGPGIVRRAVAQLSQNPHSLVNTLVAGNSDLITSHIIQEAAEKGDGYAIRLLDETADYLGMAISGILDILSLEAVILAGGVAQMGELLIAPLERSLVKYAITPVPVYHTRVGRDLGALGAAAAYFFSGEGSC